MGRSLWVDVYLNKLILISLFIFFAICSKSWAENSNLIPDGKWYGNFAVGGEVHCSANIRSITIINNVATVKGIEILGPINYKFTVGADKFENRLFTINNMTTNYKFTYNRVDNTITLSFDGACVGKETFKQKDSLITKKTDLDIKSIIKFSEDICKEIGLEENKNYYDKCVLTLIKNFNNF